MRAKPGIAPSWGVFGKRFSLWIALGVLLWIFVGIVLAKVGGLLVERLFP